MTLNRQDNQTIIKSRKLSSYEKSIDIEEAYGVIRVDKLCFTDFHFTIKFKPTTPKFIKDRCETLEALNRELEGQTLKLDIYLSTSDLNHAFAETVEEALEKGIELSVEYENPKILTAIIKTHEMRKWLRPKCGYSI